MSPEACFRFSISLSVIFPGLFLETNAYKILKSDSRSSSERNALNFFSSRIHGSEALVYNLYFFQKSRSTEIIRH